MQEVAYEQPMGVSIKTGKPDARSALVDGIIVDAVDAKLDDFVVRIDRHQILGYGITLAQVTAAALASNIRQLASCSPRCYVLDEPITRIVASEETKAIKQGLAGVVGRKTVLGHCERESVVRTDIKRVTRSRY
jgi:hypothetical protein